jgi:hypothetical protein
MVSVTIVGDSSIHERSADDLMTRDVRAGADANADLLRFPGR